MEREEEGDPPPSEKFVIVPSGFDTFAAVVFNPPALIVPLLVSIRS